MKPTTPPIPIDINHVLVLVLLIRFHEIVPPKTFLKLFTNLWIVALSRVSEECEIEISRSEGFRSWGERTERSQGGRSVGRCV